MSSTRRFGLASVLALALPAGVIADTLVMRNGTRVTGELVAVRNGTIEFEERRSFGSSRTIRVGRDEVTRIDFDDRNTEQGSIGGGRPGGMRERQVAVSATTPWTDTGIDVRSGQTIYLEASGTVTWGPSRRDGPEGERDSPRNPARPMPNRPAAALIGKVGEGLDLFFIGGDTGPIRVRNGGRLYLGINDDGLQDNRGSFRVIVHY
jgi:hypothetical protein